MNHKKGQPPAMEATQLHDASLDALDERNPALSQEIQDQLGKQLQRVYGKLLSEPLPDKFATLLQALSKPEAK